MSPSQAECSPSPSTCVSCSCLSNSAPRIDYHPDEDVAAKEPVVGLNLGTFDPKRPPPQAEKKMIMSLDNADAPKGVAFVTSSTDEHPSQILAFAERAAKESLDQYDAVKDRSSPSEVYDWLEREVERFEKLIAEKNENIEIANKRSRDLEHELCDDETHTVASTHTQATLLTHLEEHSDQPQQFAEKGSGASLPVDVVASLKLMRDEVIQEETPSQKEVTDMSHAPSNVSHGASQSWTTEISKTSSRGVFSLWIGRHQVQMSLKSSRANANSVVLQQSALGQAFWKQLIFYSIALGGFVFTLAATSVNLGGKDYDETDDHRRRLAGGVSPLMKDITFTVAGAGVAAWVGYALYLPLMIGYLLGGVLVGPVVTEIVADDGSLAEIISFGIILVLFMVGLDLDVLTLFVDAKKVPIVGFVQFPLCAVVSWAALTGLEELGFSFGEAKYSVAYCAICCSISSASIIGGVLAKRADLDIMCTTLTSGVLLCQVLWAGVVMAAQPHVNNFDLLEVLKSLGGIVGLIAVSLLYAKFILPSVLLSASKSIELLLVVALSWCFFVCTMSLLPFVNVPMELGSIVSGACLASFPYSRGFNSKIKYIRDFFLTLFFAGLGTQIPAPTWEVVGKALVIAVVVLVVRWVGVFLPVKLCCGENRLGIMTTINLSQVSELGMILAALGQRFRHIDMATEVMLIWVFVLLAIPATPLCEGSYEVYKKLHDVKVYVHHRISVMSSGRLSKHSASSGQSGEEEADPSRMIVLLGFHKITHMLIADLSAKRPDILKAMHVIHPDPGMKQRVEGMGIKFTCEDIANAERLMKSQKTDPSLVISTLPGSMLQLLGTSNEAMLNAAQDAWEHSHIILTEEHPMNARKLYQMGAHYIVRLEKLCAERLQELIASEGSGDRGLLHGGEFQELFEKYREKDTDRRGASMAFNRQIS